MMLCLSTRGLPRIRTVSLGAFLSRPRQLATPALLHKRRTVHTNNELFHVSDEVRNAVSQRLPVVALETTIYTHGFPYPESLHLSRHLESLVRANGAIPATVGILDGIARVGMPDEDLDRLIAPNNMPALKVSRRDLAFIGASRLQERPLKGGTTVSGTMVLAHLAGIKVFATGGLGGVHRGGEDSMDVSADLTELGRTPMAVICSGCKSFLDIPRTLEFLETQGVGVATFADGRQEPIDFPAFWARESGVRSPLVLRHERDAATMISAQSILGLSSGLLFANPIAPDHAMPRNEIDRAIAWAIQEAQDQGITGKDNTPYILSRIRLLTKGKSMEANRALVEGNVVRGARVARELSILEGGLTSGTGRSGFGVEGPALEGSRVEGNGPHQVDTGGPGDFISTAGSTQAKNQVEILVAGSLAVDLACDMVSSRPPELHTSNPASIRQTIGGVGHNVALAAHLLGASVSLCTRVGDDLAGHLALKAVGKQGMPVGDVEMASKTSQLRTAQYVAVNDTQKSLFVGMADMNIMDGDETLDFDRVWIPRLQSSKPKWVVIDANWKAGTIRRWIKAAREVQSRVAFEPVSVAKSSRLFERGHQAGIYPSHEVDLAAPNQMELAALYDAVREAEQLQRPEWWRLVDSFGLSGTEGSERLRQMTSESLVNKGIPQQSIQLLPFIPCLLTKMGAEGVLLVELLGRDDARLTSPEAAAHIFCRFTGGDGEMGGVYLRHFPIPQVVVHQDVVSVNGVGDVFLGTVLAGLVQGQKGVDELVTVGQKASIMTLQSRESVHPDLARLRREL